MKHYFASVILLILSIFFTSCSVRNDEVDIVVLPKEKRPNIIIIIADDLDLKLGTIDYMQNLQELMVARGTTLNEFYVTTPMCCTSRASILRGQYTHSHQVYNNETPYGGFSKFYETGNEASTIAVWLQAAGYRTSLIGKYFNEYPSRDNRTYVPAGWSEWASPGQKNAYDGYDYVLNENGILVPYPPNEVNYFTDVMNRKAIDFIERAAQDETPFFLYLAPFAPHEPATPARRHLDLFPSITAPRTPSFNEEDVSDKPGDMPYNPLLTEEQGSKIDEMYRQRVLSMQAVDEMILSLITTLEQMGELDNTYIVFTSDQGYHLGQHRLFYGKSTFYEEDIAVPFIVRGPGIPEGNEVSNLFAGNVDIAPTFAEWAGVTPPEFVEGRSLAGVLTGESISETNWRQVLFLETYGFSINEDSTETSLLGRIINSVFDLPPAQKVSQSSIGLRTAQYMFIEHADGFMELYDMRIDPYQLENLSTSTDPAVLERLSTWSHELASCSGSGCLRVEEGLLNAIP